MTRTPLPVECDERRIDEIFRKLNQCNAPGAAVGISVAGRPVYRKGFGVASMDAPLLLSTSTRMRIYSTSKHFTCLAYLLLCEEGRAGVDDPVGKYFPEFNPAAQRVTVRQLMGNLGGLRNPMNHRWEFGNDEREIPVEELLATYRDIDDVNFAPGTSFSYNNSGFEIVAAAVERITGCSFEVVLRERIFEPVGMYDTLLQRRNSDFVPNSATMHMDGAEGYRKTYTPGEVAGAAGIVSTVDDMLRWLQHMYAPTVGSAETWALMKTPQTLANGTKTGYGMGLFKDDYRGAETIYHAGGGRGANSQMLTVPGARLDIVVMLNRSDVCAADITDRIMDACLPDLEPVPAAPEREMPTGIFRSLTTPLAIQLGRASDSAIVKKGDLMATLYGADLKVSFDVAGVLRPASVRWMRYAIEIIGDPGQPRAIRFSDYGNVQVLEAVDRVESADSAQIVGRYRSKGLDTEAEISGSGNDVRVTFRGRFGRMQCNLASLAQGLWIATQMDIVPYKSLLCFDQETRSFGYASLVTHPSPLRFERFS